MQIHIIILNLKNGGKFGNKKLGTTKCKNALKRILHKTLPVIMRNFIYILSIIIISCNNNKQIESSVDVLQEDIKEIKYVSLNNIYRAKTDSFYYVTRCDTISSELIKISEKRNDFKIFQEQSYVHCSPSSESEIIDSISFNTKLRSWKSITRTFKPKVVERDGKTVTINKGREKWLLITNNGKTGYVSENGMALKNLGNKILFGERNDEYGYKIISVDNNNKIVDSLNLKGNHGFNIKLLNYNGLDFCEYVIEYREFRESCPGGGSTTLISLNKDGEFRKIISYSYGTLGNSEIYFPLKFESGNKLLVANGNINQIFDRYNGKMNVYDYPKDLGIPIEQLIIESKIEFAGDIEGLSEDEIEIKSSETNFYKWNGNQLDKIKTTGNKVYK